MSELRREGPPPAPPCIRACDRQSGFQPREGRKEGCVMCVACGCEVSLEDEREETDAQQDDTAAAEATDETTTA